MFRTRLFQQELIRYLRNTGPPLVLQKEVIAKIAPWAQWERDQDAIKSATNELVRSRILTEEAGTDGVTYCLGDPPPIVGETAEERFARLPQLPELPRTMILMGNALLAAAALLFFIFYCTYLPQSWIGPVTGTGALIGALLSYAGLRLSDQRAVTALQWTKKKWFSVLFVCLALGVLNLVGMLNPCVISAPPGARIYVDGQLQDVVPAVDPFDENGRPLTAADLSRDLPKTWMNNGKRPLRLRWDPHEIRVRKKWNVNSELADEFVGGVQVHWWTWPWKIFDKWAMSATLEPVLRIDVRLPGESQAGENKPLFPLEKVRQKVREWNYVLQSKLPNGDIEDVAIKPLILQVGLRQKADGAGTLVAAFTNFKGEVLQPMPPIELGDPTDDAEWEQARKTLFANLESELKMWRLVPSAKDNKEAEAKIKIAEIAAAAEPADKNSLDKRVKETNSALVDLAETKTDLRSDARQALSSFLSKTESIARKAAQAGNNDGVTELKSRLATLRGKSDEQTASAIDQTINRIQSTSTPAPPAEGPSPSEQVPPVTTARPPNIQIKARGAQSLPTVFVHIAGEPQREKASQFKLTLLKIKGAGDLNFVVPEFQNVLGRAYVPDFSEVRYFDPQSKETAEAIKAELAKLGAPNPQISEVRPTARDYRDYPDMANHYEVWLGRNWH